MKEQTNRLTRRAFLGGAVAFGVVALSCPTIALADTSAEKQAQADSVRIQLSALQDNLNEDSERYYEALDDLNKATAARDAAQQRIDETNQQIDQVTGQLSTRAKSMYRTGGNSFLDVLLGSTSFEEFSTNWDILNSMNENDASMVEQAKSLREQAEADKREYDAQTQIAQQKADEAESVKAQAEATVVQMQTTLNSLDAEARALLEQEQAAQAAAAAQQQAALMAANANAGGTSNSSPGDSGSTTTDDSSYTGGYSYSDSNGDDYSYSGSGTSIPAAGSVVDYAASRIGCPYVWGATGPDSFDCSGLTSWCYNQVGRWITRTTYTQYSAADAVLPLSAAQPGDVLWNGGHVAICTASGGGSYIHAPQPGESVCYSSWPQFSAALRFAV